MWSLLGDIITNDTESCGRGVIFNNSSQSGLGIGCHKICFIKNDDFIARAGKFSIYVD